MASSAAELREMTEGRVDEAYQAIMDEMNPATPLSPPEPPSEASNTPPALLSPPQQTPAPAGPTLAEEAYSESYGQALEHLAVKKEAAQMIARAWQRFSVTRQLSPRELLRGTAGH